MEQLEHFLVCVGDACAKAQVAGLAVRAVMRDGTVVEGVPEVSTAEGTSQEADDSGWDHRMAIGANPLQLTDVRELHLLMP